MPTELLFFVVSVAVGFIAYTRIPGLVGIERAKASTPATPALKRPLVCTGRGTIVSVLDLANLIVEPANDAAGSWLRGAVGGFVSFPRQIRR